MKQYKGNRKYEDVCGLMKDKGMQVDTRDFDKGGDFVNFIGVWENLPLTIALNTFNGQFIVFDTLGERLATHMSEELDEERWYSELLDVFYESL